MTALKPNGGDSNPLSRPQAVVLLKSGRRLDLLNPDPQAWTDEDLAAGLARTPRCGANLTSRADPRALFDEPPKHAPAARSEPAIRRDGQRACAICGAPAYFGFGVSIRGDREGRWACMEHREAVERLRVS
jgi:hypothetical protein